MLSCPFLTFCVTYITVFLESFFTGAQAPYGPLRTVASFVTTTYFSLFNEEVDLTFQYPHLEHQPEPLPNVCPSADIVEVFVAEHRVQRYVFMPVAVQVAAFVIVPLFHVQDVCSLTCFE